WTQVAELGASDGAAHDSFGWSVALSGATALVGSPAAEVNGVSGEGAAYVFTQTGDTWSEAQKLTANNSAGVIHRFGGALALEGSTALIGAPWSAVADNGEFGAAYVFGESGGNWVQTQELVPTDGVTGVSFGDAVALEGASMLIGACDETQTYVGAADVFVNQNGVWSQVQRLAASNGFAWDQFGCAVALDDGTALVGAPGVYGEDLDMGAAYFYGRCELELALSAPQTVSQGQQYISEAIATNNASAASPAVAVTATVPAAASFVSVIASQGSCSEHSGVVNCDFGAIDGNGGTATLNLTLEATGASGSTIENTASIAKATPALTASAATEITGTQSCPDGYSIFTGTLPPNGRTRGPSYEAPAGEENAILYAPAGFRLYGRVDTAHGRRQQSFPGNEVHRWGPAGTYAWGIRAGEAGGAYTICTLHP
ncbi:MAG TPA: hypothetical protein VFX38_00515, partial [Gammaproteobacteria bacterium]|nr:hypothetical protein [Gammaproteobacteria bacterium]